MDIKMIRLPDKTVLTGKVRVKLPVRVSMEGGSMELKEMVAIVTGGTRGIGEAIARKLAANGVKVIISFKRDARRAKEVVADIQSLGGTAHAVRGDVTMLDDVQKVFEESVTTFGKIDVIVNNATPPIRSKSLFETKIDEFTEYFNAYVLSTFELVRLAIPGMRERKFGRIVNILTSAIHEVPPKLGAYITAKSALHGLSRAMAVELGPWGINVNMVSPSAVISHYADELGVGAQELIARKVPLRRLGKPEEVADLVLFLVSKSSSYISGANIPVTGGVLLV
jgi:3-oxoacyl-[acyl-carrier protein] reductase